MKKAITIIVTVLVFTFIGLFILRCCMAADTSVFSRPVMTDALSAAFEDGESVIYTVKQTTEISSDGYFKAYKLYYNPESGELQFAVRWNDSVYKYTETEDGHEFPFRIKNSTTGEEYTCTVIEKAEKSIYNYRRMTAENVTLSTDDELTVIMEVNGTYESTEVIKYAEQKLVEYKKTPETAK